MLFNRKTDGTGHVECLGLRLLFFYGSGQSLPPLSGHRLQRPLLIGPDFQQ